MTKYSGKDLLLQRSFSATAWAASTAYAVGVYVTNSTNVYRCKTAGTSAASGGPSTTAADITDGTAHWTYIQAVATGTVRTIAGMRSTSMSINNEQVDVTDKGDSGWRTLLAGAGIKTMSASASGMFTDDVSHIDLQNDIMQGAIISLTIVSGRGDKFVGMFQVVSLERSGEYNGAEQFSLSLESSGAIVYTPAP